MARGASEYEALTRAMWTATPACLNDPRYTAEPEELDDSTQAEMRARCRGCEVVNQCAAFALAAKPRAGMWAGAFYPMRGKAA